MPAQFIRSYLDFAVAADIFVVESFFTFGLELAATLREHGFVFDEILPGKS